MKELFINGRGCISPQHTCDNSIFLPEIREYSTNKIFCIEPDYASYFDAASLRRMGRLIKFATASAFIALKDAGIKVPGAITTGTGFGLLENSGKFLKSVIEQDEAMVSPTAFIQSTHNTIGGIIALLTGCTAHNNTFSHKGFSFESALQDAAMVMNETGIDDFLVGGFDELTEYSLGVISRLNILRSEPVNNLDLYKQAVTGTIVGEGAAFFVLSKEKKETCYGKLLECRIFTGPDDVAKVKEKINGILNENGLHLQDVDVVLSGLCGDAERDKSAIALNQHLFSNQTILAFKHLCGEYMTASSFAFWLAAKMLKTGHIPETVILENRNRLPKNILIYNSYKRNHSLILLQSC